MSRLILGINSAHADSSAAVVSERGIVAAIAEERINRKKHCSGFPRFAVQEVLRLAGAALRDVTDIAVARDAQANLSAKMAFVARHPAAGVPRAIDRLRVHHDVTSSPELIAEALGGRAADVRAEMHHVEHHLAHVSSAFYWSPFERATGVSVDGAGDFATNLVALCEGNRIRVRHRTLWPQSLGVFYTALCQFIGFDRFGEEYKVMGLSAYGINRFAKELRQIVRWSPRRGIRLGLRYFRHHRAGLQFEKIEDDQVTIPTLWSDELPSLLGLARQRGEPLSDRDRDIAASVQTRFEDVYLALVASAVAKTGIRNVAFAGGSVLNSVGNGRLLTERVVDQAYFHPAASDDGTAVGAALHVLHGKLGMSRTHGIAHAYWGTEWTDQQIERAIVASDLHYRKLPLPELLATAADALAEGKIVGWFQGREEWGPRALGNRSILCHPGWPAMKATLNARIKNREPFRPFAPAVLAEKLSTCFRGEHEVPFMIVVYKVRPEWKERLSAITHEDGTGRVQTVRRDQNELYYNLISAFEQRTGIPVLLNTSFNENEPIVHTPEQALDCFSRTRMDALGIGPFWLAKTMGESPEL
jgi:carbamoyltransferase